LVGNAELESVSACVRYPAQLIGTAARPVEVLQFACAVERDFLASIGAEVALRRGRLRALPDRRGQLDPRRHFGPIPDAEQLAAHLESRAGIVEHGLFLDLTHDLLVATEHGVDHVTRP